MTLRIQEEQALTIYMTEYYQRQESSVEKESKSTNKHMHVKTLPMQKKTKRIRKGSSAWCSNSPENSPCPISKNEKTHNAHGIDQLLITVFSGMAVVNLRKVLSQQQGIISSRLSIVPKPQYKPTKQNMNTPNCLQVT